MIRLFVKLGATEKTFPAGAQLADGMVPDPSGCLTLWRRTNSTPAHLLVWLAPGENLGDFWEIGFFYEWRFLTRQSKLLAVKTMATDAGDLELGICEVRPILAFVIIDSRDEPSAATSIDRHVRLMRSVQEDAGQPLQERLVVDVVGGEGDSV